MAGHADLGTLADEIFAVADLLDRERGLRRDLSDPARPAAPKDRSYGACSGGRSVTRRWRRSPRPVRWWARSGELPDALERLGVTAAAAEAEAQGKLDEVEDELFRFGRIVGLEHWS